MAYGKKSAGADFFKEELKSGLNGAYFFYGEEDYMKQYYLHEAEKQTVENRDSMNFIRLTNDDFTLEAFEEAVSCSALPGLFSPDTGDSDKSAKRLTELYEIDFKSLKPSEFSSVCELIKQKSDKSNIIIIYSTFAEMPDSSKPHQTIINELSKAAAAVEFKTESDTKLCSWLVKLAARQKVALSPEGARLLLERIGHSMSILKNEAEKLCAYVLSDSRDKITREDIIKVSCPNREISPFDFTNAIMRCDAKAAFSILYDMKMRSQEPAVILSTVSRVLFELINIRGCLDAGMTRDEISAKTKIHAYKVKLYAEALKNVETSQVFKVAEAASEADLLLKTSPVDSYTVIERLICGLTSVR